MDVTLDGSMLETPEETQPNAPTSQRLAGMRVGFLGRLGSMNHRQAMQVVADHGGIPVERRDSRLDLIVFGGDDLPLVADDLLTPEQRMAADEGHLSIISETALWERLGLVPADERVQKLYTPAMLAQLIDVPVATVRRWHRRGLIVPARQVHKLPYFDFQEVATARHLAQLLAAGATVASIEKKLSQLSRWVSDMERPLAQLSVIVEGRDLLLRDGEGLVDLNGQRRIDFDASEAGQNVATADDLGNQPSCDPSVAIYSLANFREDPTSDEFSRDNLLQHASSAEENGQLEDSIAAYRTVLAVHGPDAEVHFLLAELLYRVGDITAARERYFAALEIDEDYVEARANLGCVLAETGQHELAIAAFRGALSRHVDYPDVHYHLACTLDEIGRTEESLEHWRDFLKYSPDSPWAEEARDRLGITD